MSMQDRAGTHAAHNGYVEQRFCRGLAIAANDAGGIVDLKKLRGRKRALVQSRRSNRQAQRLSGNYGAEVSTRSQNPSARVKIFSNPRQFSGSS